MKPLIFLVLLFGRNMALIAQKSFYAGISAGSMYPYQKLPGEINEEFRASTVNFQLGYKLLMANRGN